MTYPRTVLLVAVVGTLLLVPVLGIGFATDDPIFLAVIEGWYPEVGQPFNLYGSFIDLPNLPWWTSPELGVAFWRPLSSALVRLDHWLFGRWALGYQLHSLLWLFGLTTACGLLFSRLPRRLGVLALVIFMFDEGHTFTGGMICNRHALVSTTLALLGLLAHLRWREQGWRPGLPLSIVGFAGGLLGGEMALSMMAFALSYELFAGCSATGRPVRSWRQRLIGILPTVLLATGYLLWYKASGYGATDTNYYLDPTGEPIALLAGMAAHVAALLASAVAGLPAELWAIAALRPLQIALGVSILVGTCCLLWLCRSELGSASGRELRWLVPGALAAMLPSALPFPHDRLLLPPMIGFAVLLAFFVDAAWYRWRRGWSGNRWQRLAAGAFLLVLFTVHFVAPPLKRTVTVRLIEKMERYYIDIAAQIPPDFCEDSQRHMILVNGADLGLVLRVPLLYDLAGGRIAASWHSLSGSTYRQRLVRTGPRTLVVEVIDGQLLSSFAERVLGSNQSLAAGDTIDSGLFQVKVLAANAVGPTRVTFHFDRELENPDLVFMMLVDGKLRQVDPPAVGEYLTVKRSQGPLNALLVESE